MSPVVQGLPQATTACVPVRNWRTESPLAERTAINMVANKIFFIIASPHFTWIHFGDAGAGPSGWQTPVVPSPRPKKQKHRLAQIVARVHGLPQAVGVAEAVRS